VFCEGESADRKEHILEMWCVENKIDCCGVSIREFCELQTPIFMFDKDGAFVVMKLEQVSVCQFGYLFSH
jgi:hypothetical protein